MTSPDIAPLLFLQRHSAILRIWHWLTFLFICGSMITVLLTATILNQRNNIAMVQEQLKSKGITVSDDQAFSVTREFEDKSWGVHKLFGYGLAFLLFSRVIIELTQPGDEKIRKRFKNVLRLYRLKDDKRNEYRHYLGVKITYLIFYILLLFMALTGLGLAFGHDLGFSRELHDTIKEIHSIGQYFMYAFVFFHLCGVVIGENIKLKGIVSGMINGNKLK